MFIPAYRGSLSASVLRHSADAYVGYLKHQQYCPATIRAYLNSIEHFAHWVSGLHIPLSSIDESFTPVRDGASVGVPMPSPVSRQHKLGAAGAGAPALCPA